MATNGFSPIQMRMIEILADGQPHHRDQLFECMENPMNSRAALWFHLGVIRKHLRPRGQNIICELIHRAIYYRHVQLIAPASRE